jgi:hypothetical protein
VTDGSTDAPSFAVDAEARRISDSSDADRAPGDGGTAADAANEAMDASTDPCGKLTQCCGGLVFAPPLAAACYAPTVQVEGGAAPSCVSTLEGFREAGLCP